MSKLIAHKIRIDFQGYVNGRYFGVAKTLADTLYFVEFGEQSGYYRAASRDLAIAQFWADYRYSHAG